MRLTPLPVPAWTWPPGNRGSAGVVTGQGLTDAFDHGRVAGDDAEFPVIVEAGHGEVLRADQRLLAGPAGVGDDCLSVNVRRRCCRRGTAGCETVDRPDPALRLDQHPQDPVWRTVGCTVPGASADAHGAGVDDALDVAGFALCCDGALLHPPAPAASAAAMSVIRILRFKLTCPPRPGVSRLHPI